MQYTSQGYACWSYSSWLPLIFTSHLHISARHPCCTPVQHRFALHGYSSRAIARTQPVASVIHRLPCEAVHSASDLYIREPAICSPESGSGVVQDCFRVWNGYGTVWNGVWNETAHSSTAATTQRIFISHAAHLYQNWQIGARVDCQPAAAKRIPTITQQSR